MDDEEAPGRASVPAVTTEDGFQKALRALVTEADTNGVDVRGGWPVARGDETKMWDVEIAALARSTTAHVDDAGSAVASIIGAVAAREGVDTNDLPPLQEAVDHEVLEMLLDTSDDGPQQYVRFRYCGYEITVRKNGDIRLKG
ncbi:HalOD1 output domain-containing protein [Halorarius halobius]|uniref:HalOD1 output domain-containing protein n=1 Tax=Halorarius halobius TaxID=2962671 RepID=UPI0020CD32BA|nr:HalOD1 output domain-containing protein [Halorarius halobius]